MGYQPLRGLRGPFLSSSPKHRADVRVDSPSLTGHAASWCYVPRHRLEGLAYEDALAAAGRQEEYWAAVEARILADPTGLAELVEVDGDRDPFGE